MKERVLYEDLYLKSTKEIDELIKDYFDGRDDMDEYTREQQEEMVNEWLVDCFHDDFGKNGNLAYSNLKDVPVVITGELGLWDGKHKIIPVKCNNLSEAVDKIVNCDCDYYRFIEDRFGNLKVEAIHHDGTNHFTIKKWTPKGQRCLHYCREVFGA